jgi:hypothetical protein
MICDFAKGLSQEQLSVIEGLEHELGSIVLAFRCKELDDPAREERVRAAMEAMGPLLRAEVAEPDEGQLGRIREVEQELGLSLVAVKS